MVVPADEYKTPNHRQYLPDGRYIMISSPIIYKFRDWKKEYHKSILLANELFFANPIEINDPFDFKISLDLTLLDTHQKKEAFIDALLQEAKDVILERNINPVRRKQELLYLLNTNINYMQEGYESTEFNQADTYFGIISFSQRWDSILLWSHYAANHNGFCVGFNKLAMQESGLFGAYGPMNYSDTYPKINPLYKNDQESIKIKTFTKLKEWSYEEEYRFANIFDKPNLPAEKRIIKFPLAFIEEVILGLKLSDSDKQEIISFCKTNNIPIYQIKKQSLSYQLNRVKI